MHAVAVKKQWPFALLWCLFVASLQHARPRGFAFELRCTRKAQSGSRTHYDELGLLASRVKKVGRVVEDTEVCVVGSVRRQVVE